MTKDFNIYITNKNNIETKIKLSISQKKVAIIVDYIKHL